MAPNEARSLKPSWRRSSEREVHIAIVHYLRHALPPNVIVWHSANGEHRDRRTAQKLKAFGVLAGVADLAFVLPPDGRTAFIEVKAEGGRLSTEQRTFRDRATAAGALFAECRSIPDVEATLTAWGVQLKARTAA